MKPIPPAVQEFARLQVLIAIDNSIRKMSKIKISAKNKPILSDELEEEIESAMMMYSRKGLWVQWGMDTLRKNGNMVLLFGPPGTGKTTIANYMSKSIGKGMVTLNMKDVGGKAPGHTERMVSQLFQDARLAGYPTIFMDECEALVWDRNRAGSDSMWMVGVIDEVLMQTAAYPGLIVAASNQEQIVDSALKNRAFATLQIGVPAAAERFRIWQQKIPARFPLQFTTAQFQRLAMFEMVGRDIVNAIVKEASRALAKERKPTFGSLIRICEQMVTK